MAAGPSYKKKEPVGELACALKTAKAAAPGSSGRNFAPKVFEEFDDEVFQDAVDSAVAQIINLEKSFEDCEKAIHLFFNNDLQGAMAIMKPWSRTSLYHSLGLAIFEFIPAMLTFDPEQIQAAITAIKHCITICHKNRRQFTFVESIGSMIKKPNLALYSDLQAHAELCFAEALLLQAALTVIEGEDLTGLVKGGLKVRTCYNTYQACWEMTNAKKWETMQSLTHFHSGVRLGTGTFNLMLSLLPSRLASYAELVGFTGTKMYALTELNKGATAPGMRSVLCELTLLAYHLIMCPFVGGQGNMKYANQLLQKTQRDYPDSVWFLALRARSEFLHGRLDMGIEMYNRSIINQQNFRQFRLLCFWELMWVHGLKLNLARSAHYAAKLVEESAWSKTTHIYIRAAMMLQAFGGTDPDHRDIGLISELLTSAPGYKVRIAGKSLPMEKFVIRRCARFQKQGNRLLLPGLELMCLWNLFPILTNNKKILQSILKMIEKSRATVQRGARHWMGEFAPDNFALLHFVNGCALVAFEMPRQALAELEKVVGLRRDIKEDHFLVPYAICEMAMCYYQMDEMITAMHLLDEANKKYSGYNLESRLHFRVHARKAIVRDEAIGATEIPPPTYPILDV